MVQTTTQHSAHGAIVARCCYCCALPALGRCVGMVQNDTTQRTRGWANGLCSWALACHAGTYLAFGETQGAWASSFGGNDAGYGAAAIRPRLPLHLRRPPETLSCDKHTSALAVGTNWAEAAHGSRTRTSFWASCVTVGAWASNHCSNVGGAGQAASTR